MFLVDWIKGLWVGETVKRQSRSQPVRRRKLKGIDGISYFPGKKSDGGVHDRYAEQFEQDAEFREFDSNIKEIVLREKEKLGMKYD